MLFARQMAWYESRSSAKAQMTRAGEITTDGGAVELPPFPTAALLVAHLGDCGLSRAGANGPVPISAQELSAWASGTCTDLGPIDFQDMLDASKAYVTAYAEFDAVMVAPPWSPELTEEEESENLAAQERLFDILMGVEDNNGS